MITVIIWMLLALFLVFGFVVFFGSPYVPTLRKDRQDALDTLYKLGKADTLVDLGSGDGVILREASRRGARAFGVELNPVLVAISRFLSRNDTKVEIVVGNLRTTAFPDETTVVYVFGNTMHTSIISSVIQREAKRIGHDVFVISYGAQLPDLAREKSHGASTLYKTSLYR